MPRYLACRAEVGFDDGTPVFTDDDVDVELGDGHILLVYFDDQGAVVFQGREEAPGRYELTPGALAPRMDYSVTDDEIRRRCSATGHFIRIGALNLRGFPEPIVAHRLGDR